MAAESQIQWTDGTWNIARGCSKVDEDCKFCYMYRESMNGTRFNPMDVVRTKTVFNMPLKYKETYSKCWDGPPLLFTSSMTDAFHPAIDSYRSEMWDIIRKCPHIIFQILSKRIDRAMDHLPADWGDGWDNVWLGTSVGGPKGYQRVYDLLKVKCKTRFLSIEPMHSQVDFYEMSDSWTGDDHPWRNGPILEGLHWIIVGGESGNETGKYRYRPCELRWIENIVSHCQYHNVPVFVKQLGTHLSKQMKLKDRHGGDISEFPVHLQVRQFPRV